MKNHLIAAMRKIPFRRQLQNFLPAKMRNRLESLVSPMGESMLLNPSTMDNNFLDTIITHRSHRLDKAIKGQAGTDYAEFNSQLEAALQECRKRNRIGDHISWAENTLSRYRDWEKEKNRTPNLIPDTENLDNKLDIYDLIKSRRSVRYFKPIEIENEKLNLILEAGKWAPCSGNRQAWHFIVQKISKSPDKVGNNSNKKVLPHGAVLLYVAMDKRLYPWKYAAALDAGAAIQNMILMAHHLGIGSCWYYGAERLNQENFRKRFELPEYFTIYSSVQFGYPAEIPEVPGRKPLSAITTFIGFDGKEKEISFEGISLGN